MRKTRTEDAYAIHFKLSEIGYHRTNGPAYINKMNMATYWWLYNLLHRYYGPFNRKGNWCIHGENIK